MTRTPQAAGAVVLASLALAPSALARPADVNIVSSVPLTVSNTVTTTVTSPVSTRPDGAVTMATVVQNMNPGEAGLFVNILNVPAGKDFVITGASGYLGRTVGDTSAVQPLYVAVAPDGVNKGFVQLNSSTPHFFPYNETFLLIANVFAGASRQTTTGTAQLNMTVMGYLVNE